MPITPIPAVALTPVAYFPKGSFLENLAVRSDGSVLVSSLLHKELWCVPGPEPSLDVEPVVVQTFDNIVMGIVEVEPEIFIVSLSDGYTTHESHLARIDLNVHIRRSRPARSQTAQSARTAQSWRGAVRISR